VPPGLRDVSFVNDWLATRINLDGSCRRLFAPKQPPRQSGSLRVSVNAPIRLIFVWSNAFRQHVEVDTYF
jgi:hypothetical protein